MDIILLYNRNWDNTFKKGMEIVVEYINLELTHLLTKTCRPYRAQGIQDAELRGRETFRSTPFARWESNGHHFPRRQPSDTDQTANKETLATVAANI
jgi:hypothetical protein